MPQRRNRPRISTSISPYTLAVLSEVAKHIGATHMGPTLDFLVHDWVGLKRQAIEAARPAESDWVREERQ